MIIFAEPMKYVNVILPLPLKGTFTYAIPDAWDDVLRIGMRVVVQLGSRKMYTGIIVLIHTHAPENVNVKEVIAISDQEAVIRRPALKFWEWIAGYYMCEQGEVYKAALPAGLKPESETEVCINPDFEAEVVLSAAEQKVLDFLSDGEARSIEKIAGETGIKSIMSIVRALLEADAIEINENLQERYKPKTTRYVRLTSAYDTVDKVKSLFETLKRSAKQLDMLMHYLELSDFLKKGDNQDVSSEDLIKKSGINTSILKTLIDKGILEIYLKETGRLKFIPQKLKQPVQLNDFQQIAYNSILKQFSEKHVILLHGITSSGKTEIYIHIIKKVLAEGKQVLYLVPEIALTTQLTARLMQIFGPELGVYHSGYSDNERVEIWNNLLKDKGFNIIIGVRSSVFLPFRQLGLVIVDEEHDSSYKQHDPAPRYHARNAAIVLASLHGAKTLLGSATPSIESFYNAQSGKYGLVSLNKRHEEIQLPEFILVDMKSVYKRKQNEGHFSDELITKIREKLSFKEQIILFQNRRGYAPMLECIACGYVPTCKSCDVSLTVHASYNALNCHYCGYTEPIPHVCPSCHTKSLRTRGFGTEKIEDELKQIFPEAKIQRLDMDTTRSKNAYQKIFAAFSEGKTDILVGTQMVTKGLDFDNVSLVGVLNADNMLHFPDFRAHERAFQMLTQVSGRAGRKSKRGQVVLQTSTPDHPVIQQVLSNEYQLMYDTQCAERQAFRYPPFHRLILIVLRHKESLVVQKAASQLFGYLNEQLSGRVLGPVIPPVSRIQNYYIRHLILKIETDASHIKIKEFVAESLRNLIKDNPYKSLKININIDPE